MIEVTQEMVFAFDHAMTEVCLEESETRAGLAAVLAIVEPDLAKVTRQRDSLARRCAARFEEAKELRRELADFHTLQRMQWDRMTEATALWRAEDPDARALTIPDLGALLQWLMDRGTPDPEPEQCTAETWSWEHFTHQQVDGYWMRCTEFGPHDRHKDGHTGLSWAGENHV